MKPTIVRRICRAEAQIVRTPGDLGAATVHEAQGRSGLMRPYLRPLYPAARAAGSAVTVFSQPGDNLMIHAAMELCQPGDVLVVTTTSESTDGMFGELLAVSARAHGIVGLIIDAGVRDVADLTAMEFPVWSKTIGAQGTVKSTAGSINVPVVCGGAGVRPGDVIVADADASSSCRGTPRPTWRGSVRSGSTRNRKRASGCAAVSSVWTSTGCGPGTRSSASGTWTRKIRASRAGRAGR